MKISRAGTYLVKCIEYYRVERSMPTAEVIALFKKYNVLDYILKNAEALNWDWGLYTSEGIDEYIQEQQRTIGRDA